METAITGLIVITVLVLAVLTISHSFLSSQVTVLESWREMEERLGERARTDLSTVSAEAISAGAVVEVTLRNEGDTKLADFDQWDVIIQYDAASGTSLSWIPNTQVKEPEDTQWWTEVFPSEAQAFDPNIFNPGEEMVIQIWVSPSVRENSVNQVTIATPNGISASTVFTR